MGDVAMFPLIITVIGGLSLVCALAAYVIAGRKHRNRQSWAFWGFLFPPSLLLLVVLPTVSVSHGPHSHTHVGDPEDDDDEGHAAEDDDNSAVNVATRHVTGISS